MQWELVKCKSCKMRFFFSYSFILLTFVLLYLKVSVDASDANLLKKIIQKRNIDGHHHHQYYKWNFSMPSWNVTWLNPGNLTHFRFNGSHPLDSWPHHHHSHHQWNQTHEFPKFHFPNFEPLLPRLHFGFQTPPPSFFPSFPPRGRFNFHGCNPFRGCNGTTQWPGATDTERGTKQPEIAPTDGQSNNGTLSWGSEVFDMDMKGDGYLMENATMPDP